MDWSCDPTELGHSPSQVGHSPSQQVNRLLQDLALPGLALANQCAWGEAIEDVMTSFA